MGLLDALQDKGFRNDVADGLRNALNRGLLGGVLGAPVDLATMALRPLGYKVEQPVMGSEWIGQKLQDAGMVSNKRNHLAEMMAGLLDPATMATGAVKAGAGLAMLAGATKGAGRTADALNAAKLAEIRLVESPAFAQLKGQDRQRALDGVRSFAQGKSIPRSSGLLSSFANGEEDIARSMMSNPGYKAAGAIPQADMARAVNQRKVYRAEPATTPGPKASEQEWADWGNQHGVNMTRTPSQPLMSDGQPLVDPRTGRVIEVPGGLDGTFTIPDLFHIKANNFDPNALPQSVHNDLMKKFMRTHTPANPDQVDTFNQLNFALLSPNAPLTQNEFLQARARLTNMDELQALAGRVGEDGLNQTAAQQLGVGAAGNGGMGTLGTADLGNQAMLAKLILDKPEMFTIQPGETMRDVTMRVMNQVPGLGPKTASLGTPWLDLNKANTSAVDLHMIRNNYPRMLNDPDVGDAFRGRMAQLLKTDATPDAILAHPDAERRAIEIIGGTDLSRKYRLKDGSLNNVPSSATPDKLAYEPDSLRDFNPFYSKVVEYVDQSRGANPEIPLFPEQWRLWDGFRGRVEPHEFAHPDFRLLPRQSWSEMQDALTAHKQAGYTQANTPVMQPSDWRKMYYGVTTPEMLGLLAGGSAAAGYGLKASGLLDDQ